MSCVRLLHALQILWSLLFTKYFQMAAVLSFSHSHTIRLKLGFCPKITFFVFEQGIIWGQFCVILLWLGHNFKFRLLAVRFPWVVAKDNFDWNRSCHPLNWWQSMLSNVKKGLKAQFFLLPPESCIKIQGDVQTLLKKCPRQKYPRRCPCTLMPSQKDRLRLKEREKRQK